jgi:anti-sigma B factor antagonist
MEFKLTDLEGVGVLGVQGELDALSSPELTRFFNAQAADSFLNVVLDLEGLSYSSSAGIRIFLGLAREARSRGGDLRIAAVQPPVDKIFKLSKFDKIVQTFSTVDEAVLSFRKK